jgi:hypothetical protein
MTHGTPPPGQPAEPDELDRLFTAYFHHQLPRSWPAFTPRPTAELAGPRGSGAPGRSRATLAVSVAVLLGSGLLLTSGPRQLPSATEPQPSGPGLLKNANAKGPDLSKRLNAVPETNKGTRSP